MLLLSFGYIAVGMIAVNERRLISIDKELEIARQMQFSILSRQSAGSAESAHCRSLGDFYEFLHAGEQGVGFLVADVSGHGVPAALISAIIKVAMHLVEECAQDPGEVLRRLNSSLASELRGRFVSAAYLWIDRKARTARYSAAGHPPLLRWRTADGALMRIEGNGLLFGIQADCEYPARNLELASGDRLLLYTDGLTEPEMQQRSHSATTNWKK